MDCSTLGLPVHHQILEFTQTHVQWVGDAIQPSHPLSSPSPLAFNLAQHQGLFQGVSYSHQMAKVMEFQLQHKCFQWTPRTDLLQNGLVGSPCSPNLNGPWLKKSWLKTPHSENEDHDIWSHHFMGNRWGNSGNSDRLYLLGLQNHCRWWLQPWN